MREAWESEIAGSSPAGPTIFSLISSLVSHLSHTEKYLGNPRHTLCLSHPRCQDDVTPAPPWAPLIPSGVLGVSFDRY